MRIHQFKALAAIADAGSVTQAAERLGLSQSAVTRSIQALESSLGVTLLDRRHRPVRLTPTGERILDQGQRLLYTVGTMSRVSPDTSINVEPLLRIGLGATAGLLLTGPLIQQGLERRTETRVEIDQGHTTPLVDHLISRQLDLVIGNGRTLSKYWSIETLDRYLLRTGLYVRADHPLIRKHGPKHGFDYEELRDYPLIGPRGYPDLDASLAQAIGEPYRLEDLQSIICEDVPRMVQVMLATDAMLVSCHATVDPWYTNGELVEVRLNQPLNFPAQIHVCVAKDHSVRLADLEAIRELVHNELSRLGAMRQPM